MSQTTLSHRQHPTFGMNYISLFQKGLKFSIIALYKTSIEQHEVLVSQCQRQRPDSSAKYSLALLLYRCVRIVNICRLKERRTTASVTRRFHFPVTVNEHIRLPTPSRVTVKALLKEECYFQRKDW